MANYSLVPGVDPRRGFAHMFARPLWLHGNIPRIPEDAAYIANLDFTKDEYLRDFLSYYIPTDGDILELFVLDRRVLLIGAQIHIRTPAGLVFTPVTNSGVPFDSVNAAIRQKTTYLVNGGKLDSTTVIADHSILLEEPDYFGIRLDAGATNLQYLDVQVQLVVRDEFSPYAPTNSSK